MYLFLHSFFLLTCKAVLYTAACIGSGSMFLNRFCVDAGVVKVVGQVCDFDQRGGGAGLWLWSKKGRM